MSATFSQAVSDSLCERVSLAGADWKFAGYLGEDWRYRNAFVTREPSREWLPGSVPGSVHWDLLRAGRLADPYRDEQSLAAEWVSQRQWLYSTSLTIPAAWNGRRVHLHFAGADYAAEVYLDGQHLGTLQSLFAPRSFELTGRLGTHDLSVVLREAPQEQSQIGYSDRVRTRKPRMSYGWDFAPRLVHVGIWREVVLGSTGPVRIANLWVRAEMPDGHEASRTQVTVTLDTSPPLPSSIEIEVEVEHPDGRTTCTSLEVAPGSSRVCATLTVERPELWWPNGLGEQPVYRCTACALVGEVESDVAACDFGIRSLRLVPNDAADGPRSDALPYTLEVNGRRSFIKGWNWVPVDAMFGRPDLSERYEDLIDLARDAGVNLLRVWGGGLVERDLFYQLCDRAGILVWQEFVQSSSGLGNEPPRDSPFIEELAAEAALIVESRRNHPSLALWCGGNELEDSGRPITCAQPNIAALEKVVRLHDPDRPFLPSSPSGPLFALSERHAEERPQDLHDVHGPWDYRGPIASYGIYNCSSALLHSEFGAPGAISRASMDHFVSPDRQWPPDASNTTWAHHGSWWLQRHWVDQVFGRVEDLDDYLLLSQWLQADVLSYAVDANRRRWPTCSGTIPWQLNEPWPNAHCTSAVDYYLRPKMAYWAVRASYAPLSASLSHTGVALSGTDLVAGVHVVSDYEAAGKVTVSCHNLRGDLLDREAYRFAGCGSLNLGKYHFAGREHKGPLLVRLDVEGMSTPRRHYVFSWGPSNRSPLREMYKAERTEIEIRASREALHLHNNGEAVALFPMVDVAEDSLRWSLGGNAPVLLPGEAWSVDLRIAPRSQALGPHDPLYCPSKQVPKATVSVRGWNVDYAEVSVVVEEDGAL